MEEKIFKLTGVIINKDLEIRAEGINCEKKITAYSMVIQNNFF